MSDRLLVLVRHGQSEWNLKNLFTGWKDPDLTEQGIAEAKEAGRKLKAQGLSFDLAFTSVLSLVPLITVGLRVMNFYGVSETTRQEFEGVLAQYLLPAQSRDVRADRKGAAGPTAGRNRYLNRNGAFTASL